LRESADQFICEKNQGGRFELTFLKYSNKDVWVIFSEKVIKWGVIKSNKFRVW